MAYAKRNTLSPDVWWSTAVSTSWIVKALGGDWVDPRYMIPGQIDLEQWRAAQEAAAEKAMDRKANENR